MAIRKWWKLAATVVALLVVLQVGVSLLVRTRRVHHYLVAKLERAFGRPVEVRSFDTRLLPTLQFDAEGVTVGEDPAFGHEYFLRAERLSAGLRWLGVLGGHFDFGTISLAKPSLILVRDPKGRWNLENWLPPTGNSGPAGVSNRGAPAAAWNRLQKIEFDDGRINFKLSEQKVAFAFINVSGTVDQVAPGRWQLRVETQPWRSGVALQSAGTILVQGDLAGTSARLQPAQISLHWGDGSLADLLRLVRGQDYGIRGGFSLDARLGSETAAVSGPLPASPGDLLFSVQSRATEIHRWDLTERADNPRLELNLGGRWNAASSLLAADRAELRGPRSSLRGSLKIRGGDSPALEINCDSMGLQASDLLAWYRAFHGEVAEGISAEQYFTGGLRLTGWPIRLQSAALSSTGGTITVPGLSEPLRVGPFRGGSGRAGVTVGPVRVTLGGDPEEPSPQKKRRPGAAENSAELLFEQELNFSSGAISLDGSLAQVDDFLKLSAAFGQPLHHGWELSGHASATGRWELAAPYAERWSGTVALSQASLAVAGLNEPLEIREGVLSRIKDRLQAQITRADAFGGRWNGLIEQASPSGSAPGSNWKFQLSVDKLDAATLDRWVGPRARPGWLQRLLPSLMGGETKSVSASELVRRVNAEGQLKIGQLTVEKLKFENFAATAGLRDLRLEVREATADWRGGKIRARLSGQFDSNPTYEFSVDWNGANLSQLPWLVPYSERLNGTVSGQLRAKTEGVGREELLAKLSGEGEARLTSLELRGLDLSASLRSGAARQGNSRWTSGEGSFRLQNGRFLLGPLLLLRGRDSAIVAGTVAFTGAVDLTASSGPAAADAASSASRRAGAQRLKVGGSTDDLRITFPAPLEQVSEP